MTKSREALDAMVRQLASDMPAMLEDRNTFFREFEDRACFILSEASDGDEAYVQAALDNLIDMAGCRF